MKKKIIQHSFMACPNLDLILKNAGFNKTRRNKNNKRMKKIENRLLNLWDKNKHLLSAKSIYKFFHYRVIDKYMTVVYSEEEEIFSGSYLARNLLESDSSQLVVFVVTIGDDFLKKYKSKSLFRGRDYLYMEAIASETVESLARSMCENLASMRGYSKPFKRLSPGWGEQAGLDWKITDQKVLFRLLGEERVKKETGVELTDGCMMIPRKSVSAVAFPVK